MKTLILRRYFLGICVLTFVCSPVPGVQASLQNDLLMYWPLDVVDGDKSPDSVGTNDLTLHNITSTNLVPGKFGNALWLDGKSQFLSLLHEAHPRLPIYSKNEFTIAMWVKGAAKQENRMIFAEGSRRDNLPLFLLGTHREGKNGQLNVMVRDQGAILNNIPTDGIAFNDEWRHVAWVNSGNIARVYINGEMDTEFRYERPRLHLNYLSIGALHRNPPVYFFEGGIDEIALWQRTLSKKEIQQLMTNGLGKLAFSAVEK
jgi:hypothetical protein